MFQPKRQPPYDSSSAMMKSLLRRTIFLVCAKIEEDRTIFLARVKIEEYRAILIKLMFPSRPISVWTKWTSSGEFFYKVVVPTFPSSVVVEVLRAPWRVETLSGFSGWFAAETVCASSATQDFERV